MDRLNRVVTALAVSIACLATTTHTQADSGLNLRIGYDQGGDTLVATTFTDGSTDDIETGSGIYVEAGLRGNPLGSSDTFDTELLVGYKRDSIDAVNGSFEFSRFTASLIQYYNRGFLRFGIGATYHVNPTLDAQFNGNTRSVETDDVFGAVAAIDYRFTDFLEVGLRGTVIDYAAEGNTIDGNSGGLYVGLSF